MNEAEFRDMIRAHFSALQDRVTAMEAKIAPLLVLPPRLTEPRKVKDIAALAGSLSERIKAGGITGVAIAFLTEDGQAHTGFASQNFETFGLIGAVTQLSREMTEAGEDGDGRGEETQSGDPAPAS